MTKKPQIEHPLINEIYNQVWRRKRNAMIAVTGDPGKGKSYMALHLAQMLDDTFRPTSDEEAKKLMDKRLVTSAYKLSEIMAEQNLKKGNSLIFDEAGAGDLDAYNWMKKEAKNIAHIFQLQRYRQVFTIFTVPNLSMLVKSTRKLLNYLFECVNISFQQNLTRVRPKIIQVNANTGDIYRKIPRYTVKGVSHKYQTIWFGLPNQYTVDAYEERMKKEKDDIIKDAYNKMKKQKKEKKEEKIDMDEIAEEVIQKYKQGEMLNITEHHIRAEFEELTLTEARTINVKAKKLYKKRGIKPNEKGQKPAIRSTV